MKYHATFINDFKDRSSSCELNIKLKPENLGWLVNIPEFEITCYGSDEKEVIQTTKDSIDVLIKEFESFKAVIEKNIEVKS